MRTRVPAYILAFCFTVLAASAYAQNVQPSDAKAHVGETITVEGTVSNVHRIPSGITFIDMGGRFPDNIFTGVILSKDAAKFPDLTALNGKTVAITGEIRLYKGKPEVVVSDTAQIKAK